MGSRDAGYNQNFGVEGAIYILKDTQRDGVYKIGCTNHDGNRRAAQLNEKYNTATRFVLLFEQRTMDCGAVEDRVHACLHKYRVKGERKEREFFKAPDFDLYDFAVYIIKRECKKRDDEVMNFGVTHVGTVEKREKKTRGKWLSDEEFALKKALKKKHKQEAFQRDYDSDVYARSGVYAPEEPRAFRKPTLPAARPEDIPSTPYIRRSPAVSPWKWVQSETSGSFVRHPVARKQRKPLSFTDFLKIWLAMAIILFVVVQAIKAYR